MPDFASLFELSLNPLELVARGTLMYWFLFLLFRFFLRREWGRSPSPMSCCWS